MHVALDTPPLLLNLREQAHNWELLLLPYSYYPDDDGCLGFQALVPSIQTSRHIKPGVISREREAAQEAEGEGRVPAAKSSRLTDDEISKSLLETDKKGTVTLTE